MFKKFNVAAALATALTHVLVDIERNSGAGWVTVDRRVVTR